MNFGSILNAFREGSRPSAAQVKALTQALGDGRLSDAQAGAFAMAVCVHGLDEDARLALTLAMRDSGSVLKWNLDAPVVDKHSTGGIGDCTSLLLAPALAACGVYVPMISGRGLGHTGGTLDKLEAIPGLRTEMPEHQFRKIVGEIGCAIVSTSADIAPADRRLYAIRDETGTVPSEALITSSILSKKLAEGLGGLVLDIKLGSGAFMKTMEDAEALARAMVETANNAGCATSALITDMNQPLAKSVGNALEVSEALHALTGDTQDHDLPDLAAALGGEVLASVGIADSVDAGTEMIAESLYDGRAAEVLARMICAMGGPKDFVERWADRLPSAAVMREIIAPEQGFVTSIDSQRLGAAVVALGGGRAKTGDKIDPSVGFSDIVALGDYIDKDIPVAMVHARTEEEADQAEAELLAALTVGHAEPDLPPTVYQRVS
ncbi:MAG: thymidine phosphorylase [Pseudomonadota bacterium]